LLLKVDFIYRVQKFLLTLRASADHLQLMSLYSEARAFMQLLQRVVKGAVGKLFDPPAVATDQLMMMALKGTHEGEAMAAGLDVDTLDQSKSL
jgi:hypothetical protein